MDVRVRSKCKREAVKAVFAIVLEINTTISLPDPTIDLFMRFRFRTNGERFVYYFYRLGARNVSIFRFVYL